MPRSEYIEHLNALKSSPNIDGVSNVRRGDDDGEFRFQVRLVDGESLVDITGLILPCKFTNDNK